MKSYFGEGGGGLLTIFLSKYLGKNEGAWNFLVVTFDPGVNLSTII